MILCPHLPSEISRQFIGHTGSVQRLAMSDDGYRVASAGSDNTIRIWEVSPRPPANNDTTLPSSPSLGGVLWSW